jgi:hypothetical protein
MKTLEELTPGGCRWPVADLAAAREADFRRRLSRRNRNQRRTVTMFMSSIGSRTKSGRRTCRHGFVGADARLEHRHVLQWADERFAGGGASAGVRDVHSFDGASLEMTSNA